jgi:hypothetical protein
MINRHLKLVALGAAIIAVAGCANSIINDPEEMARRQAEVAANTAAWNQYWSSGTPPAIADSSGPSGGDSSTLIQSSASTPSQCAAIGGTWNTGSGYCWRL